MGYIKLGTFHSVAEIEKWAGDNECWYFKQIAFKQETYLAATKNVIQALGE